MCKSAYKHVCKDTVTHLPGGAVETTRMCSTQKVVTCSGPAKTTVTKTPPPHRKPAKGKPHRPPTKPPTRPPITAAVVSPTQPLVAPVPTQVPVLAPVPVLTPVPVPVPTPVPIFTPTPVPTPVPIAPTQPVTAPIPNPGTAAPAAIQCDQSTCSCTGSDECARLNAELLCGYSRIEQDCGTQLVVAQAGAANCNTLEGFFNSALATIASDENFAVTYFAQQGCPLSPEAAQNAHDTCVGIFNEIC